MDQIPKNLYQSLGMIKRTFDMGPENEKRAYLWGKPAAGYVVSGLKVRNLQVISDPYLLVADTFTFLELFQVVIVERPGRHEAIGYNKLL